MAGSHQHIQMPSSSGDDDSSCQRLLIGQETLYRSMGIGVVEDDNWEEMMFKSDSTAQLVEEGIAITQRNEAVGGQKRDTGGNPKGVSEESSSTCSETVYGIRVTGLLRYSSQPSMHSALRLPQQLPLSEAGLDFMVKEELVCYSI
eukprot:gene31003-37470_t